jgi:hypothetical protein
LRTFVAMGYASRFAAFWQGAVTTNDG